MLVASAIGFYGSLAVLAWRGRSPRWRRRAAIAVVLLAANSAFFVVFFGYAWFTDVVGGLFFGIALLWLFAAMTMSLKVL